MQSDTGKQDSTFTFTLICNSARRTTTGPVETHRGGRRQTHHDNTQACGCGSSQVSGRQKAGHSACPRECIEVGPLRLRPGKKDSGGSMVRSMGEPSQKHRGDEPAAAGTQHGTRAHGHTGTRAHGSHRARTSQPPCTNAHARGNGANQGHTHDRGADPGADRTPRQAPRAAAGPRPTQIKRPPPANPRPLLAWFTATIVTGATADGRPAGAGAPGLLPVL